MARGGYRPGAGRPKGAKTKTHQAKSEDRIAPDILQAAKKSGMSPLDYMLAVMRSEDADPSRRDRMAVAAAPFCHPRISDNRFGKKDAAAEAAHAAGHTEKWSGDLAYEDSDRLN